MRRKARPSPRRIALLSLLLCLSLSSCVGDRDEAVVGVTVAGLPDSTSALSATTTLNGKRLGEQEFNSDLLGPGPQLGFLVSRQELGYLRVDVRAQDATGCVLAAGHDGLVVTEIRRYDVTVPLDPVPGCGGAPFPLVVMTTLGEGTGTVVSEPAGIACPGTCSFDFAAGTRVKLSAKAAARSRFFGWTGACSGAGACEVTIGAPGARVGAGFSRKACSADGWCWENPLPQGNLLSGIWGSSANDVWAVGSAGTILHWDGLAWSGYNIGRADHIRCIWGSGPQDVWINIDSGQAWHWDGRAWSNKGSFGAVFSLWGSGPNDIWGVTGSGGVVRYDRDVKSLSVKSDFPDPIQAVWGTGSDDVWAVGNKGIIMSWNGSQWTEVKPRKTTQNLTFVWGSGPNDVYAAGDVGTILHYDGGEWRQVMDPNIPPDYFLGIWGSGPQDVWFTGSLPGFFTHYDGSGWSKVDVKDKLQPHYRVWGSGPSDIWSVGKLGEMLHYDGGEWTLATQGPRADLTGIWGSGPGDLWAVGAAATILHGGAAGWQQLDSSRAVPKQTDTLRALWGSGPGDVWAVGDGPLIHWDGTAWSSGASGMTGAGNHYEVWGSGPGDVWTSNVEAGKSIMPRWNGTGWVAVPSATADVSGIWGTGPKDVWALGGATGDTLIQHWDGLAWTTTVSYPDMMVPHNPYPKLYALWGSGPGDVWAVGPQTIRHYDGMNWSLPIPHGAAALQAIWGSGPKDIWAVGAVDAQSRGTIVHLDGQLKAPAPVACPAAFALTGVWGSAADDVWAVGQSGTILRYEGPPGPR